MLIFRGCRIGKGEQDGKELTLAINTVDGVNQPIDCVLVTESGITHVQNRTTTDGKFVGLRFLDKIDGIDQKRGVTVLWDVETVKLSGVDNVISVLKGIKREIKRLRKESKHD